MRSRIKDKLKQLIQNDTTFAPGARQARVISIAAQKGGVGKTTTAVNLALALTRFYHQRVLIIDMDAQGHVGTSIGVAPREEGTKLSEVLLAPTRVDVLEAVIESGIQGLHMTAPDPSLATAEPILNGRMGREFILRRALSTARSHYDIILLDCPPNLGNLTMNALMASDSVLLPCDMSMLAVDGVVALLETVEELDQNLGHALSILGILKTRVDRRNISLNRQVEEALNATFSHLVLSTDIPVNSALAKAQADGVSIFEYEPSSRGALSYRSLGEEVLERIGRSNAVFSQERHRSGE